jgi:hypothetical protein
MGNEGERWLTVVVGAGASYDCVANEENVPSQSRVTEVNDNYRPPLTEGLFSPSRTFNEILKKYAMVSGLSEDIRSKLRRGKIPATKGLEEILRGLASSASADVRRHVAEIPLYLQELLWTVSDKYVISGRTKFSTLIHRIFASPYERVLFLSLNYDLFLDRALEEFKNYRFHTIESYLPSSANWSYVKVHGSVNWVRRPTDPRANAGNIFTLLSQASDEASLFGRLEILTPPPNQPHLSFTEQLRWGSPFPYPWLAVPARGKTFYCPDEHTAHATVFVRDCRNFLFIGFSGLDEHVIGLFKQTTSVNRLMFVCGNKSAAKDAFSRLLGVNSGMLPSYCFEPSKENLYLSSLGFASFVESPQFDDFLKWD